jgi:hypothetical protein
MGYLQALKLMVRAYKAARGVMPKGLDLLKLKMKARRKAIDAKKVIQFPPDKITPFYKPRPQGIQNLIKKGDVKIGQAPKTTKVKEPVDSKLILQESEKEMAKRMMRENKEAIKRFKEKMNKPRDDKATGGLANLSQTYDNNPTLQSQFPNKQDYLDLFSSTTTTTPQTQTYAQMTQQSPAGIPAIKPIKPIIPIPEGEGSKGAGPKGFDKGYSSANFGLGPNKDVVDYEAEAYEVGRTPLGTASQIITGIPSITKLGFEFAKSVKEKSQQALDNFLEKRAQEKAIKEAQEKARLADELARQMDAVYYNNPGATFTGGRYDGASSRSEYESNPTGFSGSS